MWTDQAFRVGDRQVIASIRVLPAGQREDVAMAIAWLAQESSTPADPNGQVWKTLIEDVLGPHLALTIDHDEPGELARHWWDETARQVTSAFIKVNALEGLIERSWATLPAMTNPRKVQ